MEFDGENVTRYRRIVYLVTEHSKTSNSKHEKSLAKMYADCCGMFDLELMLAGTTEAGLEMTLRRMPVPEAVLIDSSFNLDGQRSIEEMPCVMIADELFKRGYNGTVHILMSQQHKGFLPHGVKFSDFKVYVEDRYSLASVCLTPATPSELGKLLVPYRR